jgi:hypothetical protein
MLLLAAGMGISSSVIPYVTDQLAMARLPRLPMSKAAGTELTWSTHDLAHPGCGCRGSGWA